MSITYSKGNGSNLFRIKIDGDFVFDVNKDFRKAIEEIEEKENVVIDFSNAGIIDSSALGMLLVLKSNYNNNHSKITLENLSDKHIQIFELAKFDKFFDIPQMA